MIFWSSACNVTVCTRLIHFTDRKLYCDECTEVRRCKAEIDRQPSRWPNTDTALSTHYSAHSLHHDTPVHTVAHKFTVIPTQRRKTMKVTTNIGVYDLKYVSDNLEDSWTKNKSHTSKWTHPHDVGRWRHKNTGGPKSKPKATFVAPSCTSSS